MLSEKIKSKSERQIFQKKNINCDLHESCKIYLLNLLFELSTKKTLSGGWLRLV